METPATVCPSNSEIALYPDTSKERYNGMARPAKDPVIEIRSKRSNTNDRVTVPAVELTVQQWVQANKQGNRKNIGCLSKER